jgi:hypothetical protein
LKGLTAVVREAIVTEEKPHQSKEDAAAARAAKKAAEQAKLERETKELLARRTLQLSGSQAAVRKLDAELTAVLKNARRCQTLLNHSEGFYDEVNKLAKGKALVEVTPLFVKDANAIIRDAKEIVTNDIYLDRIKEFVPAGNNPVYPEVLVVVRAVRQSLGRCNTDLQAKENQLAGTLRRTRTVIGALECFLSGEEDTAYASKDDVKLHIDGPVDESCFFWDNEGRAHFFDFDKLDAQSLEDYLSIKKHNNDSKADDQGQSPQISKAPEDLGEESEEEE